MLVYSLCFLTKYIFNGVSFLRCHFNQHYTTVKHKSLNRATRQIYLKSTCQSTSVTNRSYITTKYLIIMLIRVHLNDYKLCIFQFISIISLNHTSIVETFEGLSEYLYLYLSITIMLEYSYM